LRNPVISIAPSHGIIHPAFDGQGEQTYSLFVLDNPRFTISDTERGDKIQTFISTAE
jgi:hypothetical protein